MPHVIEAAPTGRSKCRGCGERIESGTLRLGESLPNPFADGETLHWFHPECAAFKRPELVLEVLAAGAPQVEDAAGLAAVAQASLDHPRLQRANGLERAASGRAACRACKTPIEKGAWRIALVYHEEGRFSPAGYLHLACARTYFEAPTTLDLMPRLRRFSPRLAEPDLREVEAMLTAP